MSLVLLFQLNNRSASIPGNDVAISSTSVSIRMGSSNMTTLKVNDVSSVSIGSRPVTVALK